MRTKGAKDAHKRKPSANSSPERMRALAAARRLPEPQDSIKILRSVKVALHEKVSRKDRTLFASRAIEDALKHV